MQEGHNDETMVGNHVAVAAVFVVAITLFYFLKGASPVIGVLPVPFANVSNHAVDQAIRGY